MTKIFFFYVLTSDCFLYKFFQIFFIETIHQYTEVEGFLIIFSIASKFEKKIAI